jgi:hypothetical protein
MERGDFGIYWFDFKNIRQELVHNDPEWNDHQPAIYISTGRWINTYRRKELV